MFIYKFEKGTIKTGIEIDLATDNQMMFKENYGKFIRHYNDNQHTDEELEFVYVFVEVTDDEDVERKLILTKDENEISRMEKLDEQFELACIEDIECMNGNKPINFICMDGCCTLTEEEYIRDGNKVSISNYISVSLI